MSQTRRYYLLGFMGSGKTHLGRQLARELNWDFLDLDEFLENNEGKTINQLFAEGGENLFRELEQNYLHATTDFHQTVIATGGGAPCFFDNHAWMRQHGTTIYLDAPVEMLVQRLTNELAHRPLLAGLSELELTDFVAKKLEQRRPFYQAADYIFAYKTGLETGRDLLHYLNRQRDELPTIG